MSSSSNSIEDDDFVEDMDAISVETGEAAVTKKARGKRNTLQDKCGFIRIVDRSMTTQNMIRVKACEGVNIPSGIH